MPSVNELINNLNLDATLIKQGLELLQRPRTVVMSDGQEEILPPQVVIANNRVSRRVTYTSEVGIAKHLRRLLAAECEPLEDLSGIFDPGFTPDAIQLEAVETIASSAVAVLTGGPGTGKTTLLKAILNALQAAGHQVLCMAPTGKAAQRMFEQTGRKSGTIHRTLGGAPGFFTFNQENPLPASAIVLDETSMVDVHLMCAVLEAINTGARVLIVGDVDQLPSIGPGRVLFDLIAAGELPCVRLEKIYRQADESRIPWVARDINNGLVPNDLAGEGTDFRFVEKDDAEAAADLIVKAVSTYLPQQKGFSPNDIQVLAAQKGGRTDGAKALGVEQLNIRLQQELNPALNSESDVFIGAGYSCRRKDRVIHTKNDYKLNVMNGEVGFILDADPHGVDLAKFEGVWTSSMSGRAKSPDEDEDEAPTRSPFAQQMLGKGGKDKHVLVVSYDQGARKIGYTGREARQLHLAYAITVHKSQGSQFPAVIMPIHSVHGYMLTRPLVYTGITRAEKYVLCVGQPSALGKAARNTRGTDRLTRLQQRLRQLDTTANNEYLEGDER